MKKTYELSAELQTFTSEDVLDMIKVGSNYFGQVLGQTSTVVENKTYEELETEFASKGL